MALDSVCSYALSCEQCLSLAERVGRAAYSCEWCAQSATIGRCYLPQLHRCPYGSMADMGECPGNAVTRWALVVIALSGLIFVALFHSGYYIIKFIEALIRDKEKPTEEAERLLAEMAANPNDPVEIESNESGYRGFLHRRQQGGDGASLSMSIPCSNSLTPPQASDPKHSFETEQHRLYAEGRRTGSRSTANLTYDFTSD
eukprot:Protomagalhaensia_wolfi_Nauph_80__2298@NODE_24_length_4807_cov_26_465604_g19_i0_p4_GENE_NODE_24_length_4807_cov_26_465604_g19_i0NODE_24_length_4807_cov_26_465604_g19_i0_p4_ORF_typecomplete_len201_score19_22PSI/PF01437_25/0_44PSI_integrin/PF17205_3/2_27tm_6/PF02949_20/0_157tm_6/PF02949_20/2_2e03C1_1/PF00130_22/3_9_NODE_24_length_4807_cov_26_465604_g19_i016452247